MEKRAIEELGEGATLLDYVCDVISSGGNFYKLADSFMSEMGESISRQLVSNVANNFSADARSRLEDARKECAFALVDKTQDIAEHAPDDPGGVQRARLQIGTLQWMAERYNRVLSPTARAELNINIGMMHLDSLRRHQLPAPVIEGEVHLLTGSTETDVDADVDE